MGILVIIYRKILLKGKLWNKTNNLGSWGSHLHICYQDGTQQNKAASFSKETNYKAAATGSAMPPQGARLQHEHT